MPNRNGSRQPQLSRSSARQRRVEQRRGQRAEQKAAGDPDQLERTEITAPVLRRVLDDIGARAAELAAGRQTLKQPHHHQQDRRGNPDLRIGRQQPDREGRYRHHEDDRAQRLAAALAVAVDAEHDRADRPHHKADAEHRESQQQRDRRIAGGKEQRRNRRHEIAVNAEIVPFEDVADDPGGDRALIARPFDRYCRRCHACPLGLPFFVTLS